MKKSLYEQLGGTYRQEGDYLISNLTVSERPDSQIGHPMIGKYGRMRRSFLKEHNAVLYNELVLTGKLFDHLMEIDKRFPANGKRVYCSEKCAAQARRKQTAARVRKYRSKCLCCVYISDSYYAILC